jgi:2-iminobutanoate/2-iminopropanoate deaminase
MLECKLTHVTIRGGIAGYAAVSLGLVRSGSKPLGPVINWKTDLMKLTRSFPLTRNSPMPQRLALACLIAMTLMSDNGFAQSQSPNGVQTLNPTGAIKTEGTWSIASRAGDFIFVAGMQGINPATNELVQEPQARVRQAFLNIRLIAQSEGASLQDCVRLTVYVSDLHRFAPLVDKVQEELWGKPPYPPRTMIEVQRLFDDDLVEIDSIFYAPMKK